MSPCFYTFNLFNKFDEFWSFISDQHARTQAINNRLFNRDLNRGCLVYMISLRFSGSKFLINLRKIFRTQGFAGFTSFHFVFKVTIFKMRSLCCRLLKLFNRLLTSAFVLVNGKVFNRFNNSIFKHVWWIKRSKVRYKNNRFQESYDVKYFKGTLMQIWKSPYMV